jgi:hypothetical protein
MLKINVLFCVLLLGGFMSSTAKATTHLIQPGSVRHITLTGGASGPNVCGSLSFLNRSFFQSFPNGTQDSTPFVVPANRKLIVTDVEWSAYGGPLGTNPLSPGRTLRLMIALTQTGSAAAQVFVSRGITLDNYSATGRPGSSEQLTAGFVVEPGVSICPVAIQEEPTFGASVFIDRIILRGYLTSP